MLNELQMCDGYWPHCRARVPGVSSCVEVEWPQWRLSDEDLKKLLDPKRLELQRRWLEGTWNFGEEVIDVE